MRLALSKVFLLFALSSPLLSQQINLQTQVKGVLLPVNGGTGVNTSGVTGCPSVSGGTWTFSAANCGAGSGGSAAGGNFSMQYASGTSFAGANFTGLVKNNGSTSPPAAAVQADVNPFLTSPGPIGTGTPNSGIFTSVIAGSYAGNGATQTVLYLTQGTAAGAAPANTIRFGAPTSVTSSYDALLPTLAPTDSAGDVWVVPNGGGTGTWMAYGAGASCGSGNIPCTNTTNLFSATQVFQDSSSVGNPAAFTGNAANGTNFTIQTPGLHAFQVYSGGSGFAPNTLSFFDNGTIPSYLLWGMSGVSGAQYAVTSATSCIGWLASGNTPGPGDTALCRESGGAIDVGNGTFKDKSGTINVHTIDVNGSTFTGVFGASGSTHSIGLVPDPGASAAITHFLREDGTWATIFAVNFQENVTSGSSTPTGQCISWTSSVQAGLTIGMTITSSFETVPPTGWVGTTPAFVTGGSVQASICNFSGSSSTLGSITLNIKAQ